MSARMTEEQKRVVGASFILGAILGAVIVAVVAVGIAICRAAPLPSEEPGAPSVVIWKVGKNGN